MRCETRAACCMLWVTMTIVKRSRSSWISSSIFAVEIGSSAEVGSSSRMISGPNGDRARDAQALLLAARERQGARVELVLDLVPQRRLAKRVLDPVVELRLRQPLVIGQSEGDVLADGGGERRRLLEHHADAAARASDSE